MANKVVTVGGKQYVVPDSFDPSVAQNQQQIESQISASLAEGRLAADRAPEALEQAQGLALRDVRRTAARTLQEQRGLVGGGRGLGLARDVGLAAEAKGGALRGAFAADIAQARQDAAVLKVQSLVEEGKLLELAAGRKAAASRAQQRVAAIEDKYKGFLYTTKGDKDQMIAELRLERDAAVNPDAARVYSDAIRRLQGGNSDLPGTWDIDL